MTATPSQDERPPSLLVPGPSSGALTPDAPVPPVSLPSLSAVESSVLNALSEVRQLSFGVLRSRTAVTSEELRAALDRLRGLGLVTRLNTVIESYSSRFPGLRVDD